MEQVALFVAGSREGFFGVGARINCPVGEFCACDDAYELFGIDEVMGRALVDVGRGIRMSEPVRFGRELRCGGGVLFTSLSHKGVLAVSFFGVGDFSVQLTDLNTDRQVELNVGDWASVGFYDDSMLLLAAERPLKEAVVEEMLDQGDVSLFREVGGVDKVFPNADVSLLNATRVLYCRTTDSGLLSFNVDTRESRRIVGVGEVRACASSTGIDCGVKALLQLGDYITYSLNADDSIGALDRKRDTWITAILPPDTDPRNFRGAAFKYAGYIVYKGRKVRSEGLSRLASSVSLVRVYKDVFLVHDASTKSWELSRIVVHPTEPPGAASRGCRTM